MLLHDRHGRSIRYLRLSLTPACQMRCTYCRPDWLHNTDHTGALTPAELESLVRHLVDHHGLRKLRLTGGDPTARPDLLEIITRTASIPELEPLAMTTNGLSLASRAAEYVGAGMRRINISLDALDRECFKAMTGVDGLHRVLNGIDAALDAGFDSIKLNTVVLRGQNEHELPRLVRFAAERDLPIRFIELMPMGPLADQWADRYVPEPEMRRVLQPHVARWEPLEQGASSARCSRVTLHDGLTGIVGFITPMSCNFCAACDRLRITSDGSLYPCLMDQPAGSLMAAIRPRFDGALLDRMLNDALSHKQAEHPVNGFVTMTMIGG
ncbi:GTP 3',8-cyclase MoaA [Planctomycetales bacterium ZRK34]|nr:GTP 3',8-cyclase MoaA [Planctomycetales bacterium ZRK34]